jgi:hypothetical protein
MLSKLREAAKLNSIKNMLANPFDQSLLREVFDGCVASAAANTADTGGQVFDANTEDLIPVEALKANGPICRVLGLPQHDPAGTYSSA